MINWKLIIHDAFEVGITAKAINAAAEIFGGLFLLLYSVRVGKWLYYLTGFELREDPNDWIANHLARVGDYLLGNYRFFPIIYLLAHGILNTFLVIVLWRKKMWAYPVAAAVFTTFIFYQIYRIFIFHSLVLVAVTIWDVLLVGLIVKEYRNINMCAS